MHTAHVGSLASSANSLLTSAAFGWTNSAESARGERNKAAAIAKRMLDFGLVPLVWVGCLRLLGNRYISVSIEQSRRIQKGWAQACIILNACGT